MAGIIYSILAGLFIALQNVFNTRVSEHIGLWATTTVVFTVGLLTSTTIFLLTRDGDFSKLKDVDKIYFLGGVFGVLIIYTIMRGITILGPTYTISILMVSQLLFALMIDSFGLFGQERITLTYTKPLGIVIMIIGIIIFQLS